MPELIISIFAAIGIAVTIAGLIAAIVFAVVSAGRKNPSLKPRSICRGSDGHYYITDGRGDVIDVSFDSYREAEGALAKMKADDAPTKPRGQIVKTVVCEQASE